MLREIDAVLTQKVLISGQITDALSGRPPLTVPTLRLQFQAPPQEPYALHMRQTPDGYFAYFGNLALALPVLTDPDTLDLELVVRADRYDTATQSIVFTAAELAMSETTQTVDGQVVTLPQWTALPRMADVALTPQPLNLTGRVVEFDDPNVPVPGADVAVTAPAPVGPATTDPNGAYSLSNLPVAEEITVEVSAAGFSTLTTTIRLDYRQPVNEQHFSLS